MGKRERKEVKGKEEVEEKPLSRSWPLFISWTTATEAMESRLNQLRLVHEFPDRLIISR